MASTWRWLYQGKAESPEPITFVAETVTLDKWFVGPPPPNRARPGTTPTCGNQAAYILSGDSASNAGILNDDNFGEVVGDEPDGADAIWATTAGLPDPVRGGYALSGGFAAPLGDDGEMPEERTLDKWAPLTQVPAPRPRRQQPSAWVGRVDPPEPSWFLPSQQPNPRRNTFHASRQQAAAFAHEKTLYEAPPELAWAGFYPSIAFRRPTRPLTAGAHVVEPSAFPTADLPYAAAFTGSAAVPQQRRGLRASLQRELFEPEIPFVAVTVTVDDWFRPAAEPVRVKPPVAPQRLGGNFIGDLLGTRPPEGVTADRWMFPPQVPRFECALIGGGEAGPSGDELGNPPEEVTLDKWLGEHRVPPRAHAPRPAGSMVDSTEPRPDSWLAILALAHEPPPAARRGLAASRQQTYAAPSEPSLFAMANPTCWGAACFLVPDRRRPSPLPPGAHTIDPGTFPVPETPCPDKWMQEPQQAPPHAGLHPSRQSGLSFVDRGTIAPETIRTDKWYQPASEPVRVKEPSPRTRQPLWAGVLEPSLFVTPPALSWQPSARHDPRRPRPAAWQIAGGTASQPTAIVVPVVPPPEPCETQLRGTFERVTHLRGRC